MTRDLLVVDPKPQASSNQPDTVDNDRLVLRVPWKKTPVTRRCEIIVPASELPQDRRPIRAETREKCSIRQVNMTISLAFLAPKLVPAAVEGRLPRRIGVTVDFESVRSGRMCIPQRSKREIHSNRRPPCWRGRSLTCSRRRR
jgi:hypothetical protein